MSPTIIYIISYHHSDWMHDLCIIYGEIPLFLGSWNEAFVVDCYAL